MCCCQLDRLSAAQRASRLCCTMTNPAVATASNVHALSALQHLHCAACCHRDYAAHNSIVPQSPEPSFEVLASSFELPKNTVVTEFTGVCCRTALCWPQLILAHIFTLLAGDCLTCTHKVTAFRICTAVALVQFMTHPAVATHPAFNLGKTCAHVCLELYAACCTHQAVLMHPGFVRSSTSSGC